MPDTGNLTLSSGQEVILQAGEANYLYCYDQDGLVEIQLRKDRVVVESHLVERLTLLPGKLFDEFAIVNKSGSSNTVRFFFGRGQYLPNADRSVVIIDDSTPPVVDLAPGASIELTGSSITVESNIANTIEGLADVSVGSAATLLAAANADRLELTIALKESAANGIRVGHSGVTATKGVYIGPGSSYTVQNQAAIYAIRDGGTSVTATLIESERV